METIISSDVEMAATVLKNGGVILFPTETVYGIGADSRNFSACQRIYSIKNRPTDNPFIVHLDSIESIDEIAFVPEQFRNLISHFSPGPITYILEKKDDTIFSTGLATIGIRIPSLSITNSVLQSAKIPVSAPSANISGKPSITRSSDAILEFSGKVDFILTGEDSEIGIESTVLDLTSLKPKLLRPGKVSFQELREYLPNLDNYFSNSIGLTEKPTSPGMKYRHYAPDCEVFLIDSVREIKDKEDCAFIGFKYISELNYCLKINSNLEYMHSLYSFFIDCDKKNIKRAYCHFPFQDEFKEVLLNRIQKAILK